MKWGVRKSLKKMSTNHKKKVSQKKEEKRKRIEDEISGKKKASLRKMDDPQFKKYVSNRIKTKGGSKAKAIGSETTNFLKKVGKTAAITTGITAASVLTGGVGTTAIGSATGLIGSGFEFATGAIAGGIFGGVPAATVGASNLSIKGARYIRNVVGIGLKKK